MLVHVFVYVHDTDAFINSDDQSQLLVIADPTRRNGSSETSNARSFHICCVYRELTVGYKLFSFFIFDLIDRLTFAP